MRHETIHSTDRLISCKGLHASAHPHNAHLCRRNSRTCIDTGHPASERVRVGERVITAERVILSDFPVSVLLIPLFLMTSLLRVSLPVRLPLRTESFVGVESGHELALAYLANITPDSYDYNFGRQNHTDCYPFC